MTKHILFLCPHGAAKSVMAAVYFREMSNEYGLMWTADCAGTEPDAVVAPRVAALLEAEGIDVSDYTPRRVTADELAQADRVVSLGCTDSELGLPAGQVQHWDDIPPPSQNLDGARLAIRAHLGQLMAQIMNS